MAQWTKKQKKRQQYSKPIAIPQTTLPVLPVRNRKMYLMDTMNSRQNKYKEPAAPRIQQNNVDTSSSRRRPVQKKQRRPHRLDAKPKPPPEPDIAMELKAQKARKTKARKLRKCVSARRIQRQFRTYYRQQQSRREAASTIQKWFYHICVLRRQLTVKLVYQLRQTRAAVSVQRAWRRYRNLQRHRWTCVSKIQRFWREVLALRVYRRSRWKIRAFVSKMVLWYRSKVNAAVCIQRSYRSYHWKCCLHRSAACITLWWKHRHARYRHLQRLHDVETFMRNRAGALIYKAYIQYRHGKYRRMLAYELGCLFAKREARRRNRAAIRIQHVAFSFIAKCRLVAFQQSMQRQAAADTICRWAWNCVSKKPDPEWLGAADIQLLLPNLSNITRVAVLQRAAALLHIAAGKNHVGCNAFLFWSTLADTYVHHKGRYM